jgi:ArsR family transcriptional regulator
MSRMLLPFIHAVEGVRLAFYRRGPHQATRSRRGLSRVTQSTKRPVEQRRGFWPLPFKRCCGEIQMLTQSQLACISRAIASPSRLQILASLGNVTEAVSYQALRRKHTIRASTFSRHVRELRLAGLVEIVRHGKSASLSFCFETWHQYIDQLSRI